MRTRNFFCYSLSVLLLVLLHFPSFAQNEKKTKVSKHVQLAEIVCTFGNITLVLFEDTPIHRDNFVKLANEHFFDSTTFHRVLQRFMIQGGDPNSTPNGNPSLVGRGGPAPNRSTLGHRAYSCPVSGIP